MQIYHLKPASSSSHMSLTLLAASTAPRVDPLPFADPREIVQKSEMTRKG